MARKLLIGILAFACLVTAIAFFARDPFYWWAPRDEELISQLRAHKSAFERLRDLAQQDSDKGPFFSASQLDKVDPTRRQEYLRLFAELPHGMTIGADSYSGATRFIFAVGGVMTIGPEWVKGIEFIPGQPTRWGHLTNQLDDPASLPWGNVYLRQADEHWYLFLQKTD